MTLQHLFGFWPTFRDDPVAAVRSDFIGSARGQHFVRSCQNVVIELSDLFVVKKLAPRLHRAVGASVPNGVYELFESQLSVWIAQIRRERPADGVHTVATVAVNVPPLPSVVDILVHVGGALACGWKRSGAQHRRKQHYSRDHFAPAFLSKRGTR